MTALVLTLWTNEDGFTVSAELVLIATIAVLAMVVGLSGVSLAVNQELDDVAGAFGTINQGYRYSGLTGQSGVNNGGAFQDSTDFCDGANSITGTNPAGASFSSSVFSTLGGS